MRRLGQIGLLGVWLAATALVSATNVAAFDVRIVLAQANADLGKALQNASLLVALKARKNAEVQDILASAHADYERIVTALYQEAYYAPVVSIRVDGREAFDMSPFEAPASVKAVVIRVESGRKFRFGRATIGPLAPKTKIPEEFAKGKTARVGVLQNTVDAGVTQWREAGHAKAALGGQTVVARHKAAELDADIRLVPGPKLRFGALTVVGNRKVRTERVHDIAGFPAGHVFSPDELRLVTERLRRTGTFRAVALREAEAIGAGNTLDVTAQVTEALPRRFGAGAEISSLEGLSLSAFWLHRNLFGGAERLRIGGEVSRIGGQGNGVDYRLTLRFDRPATFNEDTDFYMETELARLHETNMSSDTFALEAGIKRYASRERTYTFGLGYRFSDITDAFGQHSYAILTAPASATFDYRDNALNAKSGYYASANLTPFFNLRGTENGVLSKLDLRGYKTVGAAKRLTFALRGQLGTVIGPDLSNAPGDFLFYSGGGGTVRGQKYKSLAVDLGGGNYIGGRSFAAISSEARFKINDKFSMVGFYDAGFVGASSMPFGTTGQWHSGAGLGVRYDTGIGPVRFDVAVPVSGPGSNSGFEIYIGIGQSF